MNWQEWLEKHKSTPEQLTLGRIILEEVRGGGELLPSIRHHPLQGGGYIAKYTLVALYRLLVESGEWQADPTLLKLIRMKPVRTLSGVTTVTVLTGPGPCPGDCIFCPDDIRMPKSYLPDEPGAARAFQNNFDPFEQVNSRIVSYEAVGHPTDKIELLILGGTWSAYPREYQETFVQRCFDAMNSHLSLDYHQSNNLLEAQLVNETALHRNVGLVIETRPDQISPAEIIHLRRMGVTKVQMGAQSLDDRILALNCRGHDSAETLRACAMLRAAGFKIVLHWMPNLLGATIDSDREDFARLWQGCDPDEIKIYPTQLLENSALYGHWQRGEYTPYTTEQLINLVADIKPTIPLYCRVNRIIRDIPSNHVVSGNRRTSLRQDALAEIKRRGQECRCIRCREIRGATIDPASLRLDDLVYSPAYAEEHFISYVTPQDKIAGYLRLSLPQKQSPLPALGIPELEGAALIREVHVYGQSLEVGADQEGAAQHIGLGTSLLQKAEEIAAQNGYRSLAVIAAVGTRNYYAARGFERGDLYMSKPVV
jgi:elongator complex protein 3